MNQNHLRIGTWNVQTLNKKEDLLLTELEKYKLDITAIQEVRLDEKNATPKKNIHYTSSSHPNKGLYGVGFVVGNRLTENSTNFTEISERLATISVTINNIHVTFICVYAPTNKAKEEEKEKFYKSLEKVYRSCPKEDLKIVLGDFNAMIGKEKNYQPYVGDFSFHETSNDNGKWLTDFAVLFKMEVSSTRFQHSKKHKVTWKHPNGYTKNQIDHILVDGRYASNVLDVRSVPEADINSDHYLVIAKLRINLDIERCLQPTEYMGKFELSKLIRQRILDAFASEVEQEWNGSSVAPKDFEKQWQRIKATLENVAQSVLGLKNHSECCQATAMSWNNGPGISYCKNAQGNIVNGTANVLQVFEEYFSKKIGYNETEEQSTPKAIRDDRKDDQRNDKTEEDYKDIPQCRPPQLDEIRRAINDLQINKPYGADGLPAELFKAGGEALDKEMQKLFSTVWSKERMPCDWELIALTPEYEKGDKTICSSYKSTSHLPIAYRILSHILSNRIQDQYKLHDNKSQIFTLRQVLEKTQKREIDIYHLFVDYKEVFNEKLKKVVHNALMDLKVPTKLINLCQMMFADAKYVIRLGEQLSEGFKAQRSIKQSDDLAQLLFNILLDQVISNRTNLIYGHRTMIIGNSSGLLIMAKTLTDVIEEFEEIETRSKGIGLTFDEEKLKIMISTKLPPGPPKQCLTICGYKFPRVDELLFLDINLNINNNISIEIQRRIMLAERLYLQLMEQFASPSLSSRIKLSFYEMLVLPILLHGSFSWALKKTDKADLEKFERRIFRRIFKNKEESTPYIVKRIHLERLLWLGVVERMDENELARRAYDNEPVGNPNALLCWKRQVLEVLKKLDVDNWRVQVGNERIWSRTLTQALQAKRNGEI